MNDNRKRTERDEVGFALRLALGGCAFCAALIVAAIWGIVAIIKWGLS